MRPVRVSENFVPVSELKAQATQWLRRLSATDRPVVVTRNGRPAGVLLSPSAYDELTERARFVDALTEGMADAEAGRVHSHASVLRRIKSKFGGGHG